MKFPKNPSVYLLSQLLLKLAPGEEITYTELSAKINVADIRKGSLLHRAKNWCLRHERIYFKTIIGLGIRRCTGVGDDEIPAMDSQRRRSVKSARKGIAIAVTVPRDELDGENRNAYDRNFTALGLVELNASIKKLPKPVNASPVQGTDPAALQTLAKQLKR